MDQATAARTIAELEAEIAILRAPGGAGPAGAAERHGPQVGGAVRACCRTTPEMFDADGHRRKLVIFTEHRDTLNYLTDRIRTLLGRPEAVVTIHGGMGREERRKAQEAFTQDKEVQVLVATDAAGEGINLQRAHLMVNYDLPWNPNRLEQRFGRIHRIGQTEVCHLLEPRRRGDARGRGLPTCCWRSWRRSAKALGGQVFDVLGKVTFDDRPLRELLIEAVRYGDQPEVRARLTRSWTTRSTASSCGSCWRSARWPATRWTRPACGASGRTWSGPRRGGCSPTSSPPSSWRRSEAAGRHACTSASQAATRSRTCPPPIRSRDRRSASASRCCRATSASPSRRSCISVPGKPLAAFVCPGHPLLDATIDLILERYRDLLKRGAVLVDASRPGRGAARPVLPGARHPGRPHRPRRQPPRGLAAAAVRRDRRARARRATPGYAPYLDYRPLTDDERPLVDAALATRPGCSGDLEGRRWATPSQHLVPAHLAEVRRRREELIDKTMAAVKERLTKEITYWDHRADELKDAGAGRQDAPAQLGQRPGSAPTNCRPGCRSGWRSWSRSGRSSPLPPVVVGGALVVPLGLLARLRARAGRAGCPRPRDRAGGARWRWTR